MTKKITFLILFHFSVMYPNDTINNINSDTSSYKVYNKKRKKIGLVLSGGGAKGLSHIGAIRELERLGIRPDYISGTSIGAIIGGLYACGYNSYEIETIMKENNFLEIIQDNLKFIRKSLYDKKQNDFMINLEIQDYKLIIPSGISKGAIFFNFYAKYTSKYQDIDDFSKLPIPFVCIATNLENGEEVVLDTGYLPLAVRASGSYPGLSSPITLNGILLVDGGISNNYPAKILKDKGIDIVIGVNVEKSLVDRKDLNNALEIINQIVGFSINNKSKLQQSYVDIEIRPEVENIGIIDFQYIDSIIEKGISGARKQEEKLILLSDSSNINIKSLNPLNNISSKLYIKNIALSGNKKYTKEYILDKLRLSENEEYSLDDINESLERVLATENFNEFYYKHSYKDSTIIFYANEKKGDYKLNISFLSYDDVYGLSIPINLKFRNILFENSVFNTTFVFASRNNLKFKTEYFIDNGITPSYGFNLGGYKMSSNAPSYISQTDSTSILDSDKYYYGFKYNYLFSNLYIQSTFREYFSLCFGTEILKSFIETSIPTNSNSYVDNIKDDNNLYGSIYSNITLNTNDDKYVPMKGVYLFGEYRMILRNIINYNNTILKIQSAFLLPLNTSHISAYLDLNMGLTLFESLEHGGIWAFSLGGQNNNLGRNFINFAGYNSFNTNTKNFILLKIGFRLKYENHYLDFFINTISFTQYYRSSVITSEGGIGLNYTYMNNLLGPINISLGYIPYKNKSLISNLNLGFTIRI